MKKENKGLLIRISVLIVLIIVIVLLFLQPWSSPVYTAHAEVTLYRTLKDGSLLTKKMENEKGKRYILIRDEDTMAPEYINKEEYQRLVAENPLTLADETQNQ
jgi:hypothetical protein